MAKKRGSSKRITKKASRARRAGDKAPAARQSANGHCGGEHYGLTIAAVLSMVGIVFIVWMVFSLQM